MKASGSGRSRSSSRAGEGDAAWSASRAVASASPITSGAPGASSRAVGSIRVRQSKVRSCSPDGSLSARMAMVTGAAAKLLGRFTRSPDKPVAVEEVLASPAERGPDRGTVRVAAGVEVDEERHDRVVRFDVLAVERGRELDVVDEPGG